MTLDKNKKQEYVKRLLLASLRLLNDYPFEIAFTLSTTSIQAETGVASFTTTITWPYESGDDVLDTYWGSRAYDYMQTHPNGPCIQIRIKIYITQANT